MVIVAPEDRAGDVLAAARASGVECYAIGAVTEPHDGVRVRYLS
jgi:hydrogenase maturation factor HypE